MQRTDVILDPSYLYFLFIDKYGSSKVQIDDQTIQLEEFQQVDLHSQ